MKFARRVSVANQLREKQMKQIGNLKLKVEDGYAFNFGVNAHGHLFDCGKILSASNTRRASST